MKNAHYLTSLVASALIASASSAPAAEGVSPGAVDRMAQVNSACPTFSWGADVGAGAYEVVAYVLPDNASQRVELTADREALYSRVAGNATSWTPSADRCLAPGGRYVWFVRSVAQASGDEMIEAGEWSAGRYFEVPAGPTPEELARALEVLKRWESENGSGSPTLSTGTAAVPVTAAATATDSGSGSGTGSGSGRRKGEGEGEGRLKSVPTASAAIRGEHPDTSGEAYGVVGTTASVDGAGLAAANMAGGPDLVLDGSANGAADTHLSESGIDRPAPTSQTFTLQNSGAGLLALDVVGDISGFTADVEELKLNGSTVIDDAGNWLGAGDTVPCAGCVGSSDLADGGVDTADLAAAAVTGVKIAAGAVGASAIRSNAITNSHLADDAVTGTEILDGSITAADVVGGGLYSAKTQLYEREVDQAFAAVQGVLSVAAACDDANDLALNGSCFSINTSGIELYSTADSHWSDPTQPAAWTCWFYNRLAVSSTITARILCVSVP